MIPPFETFYEAHRDEIFRFLVRRLGRERAEDAFQETFLRALRAYPRLEHGDHLRAWVFTIASRIVVDDVRRRSPTASCRSSRHEDGLPAFEDSRRSPTTCRRRSVRPSCCATATTSTTTRSAPRLGSTEQAARQAASAGVRRLRKEHMTVSPALDERFRAAAAAAGLLDVAFDFFDRHADRAAARRRHRPRRSAGSTSTPEPEHSSRSSRAASARASCARRSRSNAIRRELDEYFEGRRQRFDLELDVRGSPAYNQARAAELARVEYGHDDDLRRARRADRATRARRARSAR